MIKPMDHSRVLRDGHICFTAFSKTTTNPLTTLSWTMEFKMLLSFRDRVTILSRKIVDLSSCRNLCHISFSFPSDRWIPILRTTVRRSSLTLMLAWSRILKNYQQNQWYSSWFQYPLARTRSNQLVHRTWVPLLPIHLSAAPSKAKTCKLPFKRSPLWPTFHRTTSLTHGKWFVTHRERCQPLPKTMFIQILKVWERLLRNSSWRCPLVLTTSPDKKRFLVEMIKSTIKLCKLNWRSKTSTLTSEICMCRII